MCTGGAENQPKVKAFDLYGNEVEIEEVSPGEKYKNMPWHLATCAKNGEEVHEMLTLDANVEMMAILEALVQSSDGGKEVTVDGERFDC